MDSETFETELKPLLVRAHEEDRIYRFTYWTQAKAPCGQNVIKVEIEWHKGESITYEPEMLIQPLKDAEAAISADQLKKEYNDPSIVLAYKGKTIEMPPVINCPYIPVTITGEVVKEDIMDITREICGVYRY